MISSRRSLVEIGSRTDLLKSGLSPLLDHVRWIAAVLVLLAHARTRLFPDFSELDAASTAVKAFYLITLFGTQAVVIFFIVSGLLVGGAAFGRIANGEFSARRYAIDRLTRLYIVLIPAMALTSGLAWLGASDECSRPLDAATITGNLLFLQGLIVDPPCNNHPLWSLSNEAVYYVLAPALFLAAIRRNRLAAAISAAGLMALGATFDASRQDHLFGAGIWALGLVPCFVRLRVPAILPGIAFAAVLTASRLHAFSNVWVEDIAVALSLCALLSSDFPERWFTWLRSAGERLAGFSYSLYLVHMPLVQAVAWQMHRMGISDLDPRDPSSYFIFGGVVAAIGLLAWAFGAIFEASTPRARAMAQRMLQPAVTPSSGA